MTTTMKQRIRAVPLSLVYILYLNNSFNYIVVLFIGVYGGLYGGFIG